MEICIDSIESAKRAIKAGAKRLEVCAALSEDGLTPSPGLIHFIKTHSPSTIIYAMIRIKSTNFIYSKEEMDAMLYDIHIFHDLGVDGFVFGALNSDFTVNTAACQAIIIAAKSKPVTFHRAFDVVKDPLETIELLIYLGFARILTSGQKNTAVQGLNLITQLVTRARDRIIVMPGGGISPDNISMIRKSSGAKEFHASAKKLIKIDNDNIVEYASEDLIRRMIDILINNTQ